MLLDHVSLLYRFNCWRRGGVGEPPQPKDIGIAIDEVCRAAVLHSERWHILRLVIQGYIDHRAADDTPQEAWQTVLDYMASMDRIESVETPIVPHLN